jgi:hypothetical protein
MKAHILDKPILRWIFWFMVLPFNNQNPIWIYGSCGKQECVRKHRIYGNVQFVLWKAGEQGHEQDHWHDMDSSWWPQFKQSNNTLRKQP